jgi:hypothetical protein
MSSSFNADPSCGGGGDYLPKISNMQNLNQKNSLYNGSADATPSSIVTGTALPKIKP